MSAQCGWKRRESGCRLVRRRQRMEGKLEEVVPRELWLEEQQGWHSGEAATTGREEGGVGWSGDSLV